jgi:hypothetical protein
MPGVEGTFGGVAVKWVFERRFLALFRAFLPHSGIRKIPEDRPVDLNHARMTFQYLLEVLRKCRAGHNHVRAGVLRLLL